jgi:hypothetical protein
MAVPTPADVERLVGEHDGDLDRDGRLGKPRRYLAGDHDMPYMPRGAKKEYQHLGKRSIENWLPLLSDTFAKALFVDGIRGSKSATNAPAWAYWQANGLDARQTIAHRGALEYGTSYALVLPGSVGDRRMPHIRPLSPLRSAAWYRDDDDEFPELAMRRKGRTMDGTDLVEVFDRDNVYTFARPAGDDENRPWILSRTDGHTLGVTPFVRFRDRLDGEAVGIIRPAITLQDRINEIVFSTLIALQYASFRQRWATGLAIPVDEETGQPVEPFQAAVDRLWVAEDDTARFGDFAQTELSGHHAAHEHGIRALAGIAQIAPNVLTGDLVNLSADALAQMERATQGKVTEYETIFGESWESMFRLAARAAGDPTAVGDDAQVRWRDTEARSLAQTVDALGKIAQMLQVPAEALWERIPGVTDTDVERWKAIRMGDPITALAQRVASGAGALEASVADDIAEEDADAVRKKADALGVLIRAGVDAESAAQRVGLTGVEFTGAMPASLRLPEEEAQGLEEA